MNPIPDLVDNRKRQLAQVLKTLLAQSKEPHLDVVTAFFNLKGLEVLAPEIHALVRLRLLLGKEQEQSFVVGERLLTELQEAAAHAETTATEIRSWRDFLAGEQVEIRLYTKGFSHGKAYIIHGVPTLGAIGIVGSSNFTGAGLTTNRELNAVLKQAAAVKELQEWFETHWAEAEDYKEELLLLLERFTQTYTPYEIYIKVIYEALHDKLVQDLAEHDEKPSPIALADFQRDGYLAAKEILENYGGVLIADSVGLGKTYLTLRLLDDYAYRERQTALIVCPAAVADTVWRRELQRYAIPHEILTMERLSRKDFPVEDFARRFRIIVVDESHNFRNPNTYRWPNLFHLITSGETDKKVILLTATPVNNTVFDLYHQLQFITHGNPHMLRAIGISNLWEYFRQAERNQEALFEVLEALAVRRSRQFIRKHYPGAEIDGQKIRFPERELHTVRYSLKTTYGPQLYQKIARVIEDLLLAPYQIESYRRELLEARRARVRQLSLFDEETEPDGAVQRLQAALGWTQKQAHEFLLTIGRQAALAHIMRVLYLKRLESSVEALRISLRRLRDFLQAFLRALDHGRLLQSSDFRYWLQREAPDDEVEEEAAFQDFLDTLPEIPPERYDVKGLRSAVQADLHAIEEILEELEKAPADDKLESLKRLLRSPELQGHKVVVFTYFKDTARYLYRHLKEDPQVVPLFGSDRISIVDSLVKPSERSQRIIRFAPQANGRPDLPPEEQIDLLISTDVLSEGQNLQDADVIINYDLHWNPVRMVQRIGRLDRLGSPHEKIRVYNFFPENELEDLLRLLERLRRKLDAINRTVGLDASILGEAPNPMDFNTLRRLAREEEKVLEELEAESELTIGEFLQQDLLRFLKEVGEKHLQKIPLGVGTAMKKKKGVPSGFFVAFRNTRTDQHHWLFYDEENDRIIRRRLEAIYAIRCGPKEPAEPLPEEFDPRPLIRKLRRDLWDRLRAAQTAPRRLPSPQRQLVNWLRAQLPSAERNRLLQYFENRGLVGPDLKELRRLWRNRSSMTPEEWIQALLDFVQTHPQPSESQQEQPPEVEQLQESDLECVAWVKVL